MEGCGLTFVRQPGYSTMYCPEHDPALGGAPAGYRSYKITQATLCARCGETLLQ